MDFMINLGSFALYWLWIWGEGSSIIFLKITFSASTPTPNFVRVIVQLLGVNRFCLL